MSGQVRSRLKATKEGSNELESKSWFEKRGRVLIVRDAGTVMSATWLESNSFSLIFKGRHGVLSKCLIVGRHWGLA
jgi:hypothetical protein